MKTKEYIKFDSEYAQCFWSRVDQDWVVYELEFPNPEISIKTRKIKNAQWNRHIWEDFEKINHQIFPWFLWIQKWNEDMISHDWLIGIEVKSGRRKKSHAVINEHQIRDNLKNFSIDTFFYSICYYDVIEWRRIPQVIFVFPIPVILSFFQQTKIIASKTSQSWSVRRFVVMRYKQALTLFRDIENHHQNIFATYTYTLSQLENNPNAVLCIVDTTQSSFLQLFWMD